MAEFFLDHRRARKCLAAIVACGRPSAILAAGQAKSFQNGLPKSPRAPLLGRRLELRIRSCRPWYRCISEPALSESSAGSRPGTNCEGGLDSNGRVGGGVFLLGLDCR